MELAGATPCYSFPTTTRGSRKRRRSLFSTSPFSTSLFLSQQHHHSSSSSFSSKPHFHTQKQKQLRFLITPRALDSTQSPSPAPAPTTTNNPPVPTPTPSPAIVPDAEFTLAKVSFGVIGLGLGVSLLGYGFGAYFNILPGSEWSAIMLTYGFPLAIIGMALKYAELKPVPCVTYQDAQLLREKCATPILKQTGTSAYALGQALQYFPDHLLLTNHAYEVRNDVIRFRYGDEQHLEEALKRIFQYGLGGGIPRRSAPILKLVREEVTGESRYSLVLVFEAKDLQLSDFEKRRAKFASFFGPGIEAEIVKGENNLYEVRLISNTTL